MKSFTFTFTKSHTQKQSWTDSMSECRDARPKGDGDKKI
jgi:hypothetical protein